MVDWPLSKVATSILPPVFLSVMWSLLVTALLGSTGAFPGILAGTQDLWIPLSLQGSAIGLVLVFRTNNAYMRLDEAREKWGQLLHLMRDITIKVSVALPIDIVCCVCRYLCAFSWSLRDRLRGDDARDDILSLLLDSKEVDWVSKQHSRPLAIMNLLRRLLYKEYSKGNLDMSVHSSLDSDLEQIDGVVESCERLFSSPIPPSMARHGLRALTLWILSLPIVLTSRMMKPLIIAIVTAATTYIYLGVDELGCRVEQPFKMMPLWQLCHLAQLNVEEALSTPDMPLKIETPLPESTSSTSYEDYVEESSLDYMPNEIETTMETPLPPWLPQSASADRT
jgi:putative membrane protein